MKNKLLVVLTLFMLGSFANAATWIKPEKIVHDYMSAWNEHNSEKAASYLSKDVQYYDVTVGKPAVGQINAKNEVIKVFFNAVPNLKWVMIGKPIIGKDSIAFEWQFSGKNTGAWSGVAPTNKEIVFKGVSFMRIHNGKIVYQGDYYDAADLNKQLGF